jgi:peptidyl-prolyl cis-trans isomerase C
MRVSPKRFDKLTVPSNVVGLVLLMVCVIAGSVFALGKPAKEEKMTVKEEVKDINAVQIEEKKEDMKAVAPAVEPSVTKPVAAPSPAETKPAETSEGKDVAVTVNGKVITEAELDEKLKPIIARAAVRMDPNNIELYKSRVRGQALEGMIMERLLDDEVKKAGITVTDKDINDKVNEILTRQGVTMDGFKQMLQMQGMTFEQFMQQIEKGTRYEKLMELKAGSVDVNDAEALAFYEKNNEDFNTPEQVQASHILIKVAPTATPEEKAAAKEKIEKMLKQVKEGGDFAALAKENSDCPSKAKGGDLGFFERGQMVKEFEDTAFGLKPGEASGVVETQFGYHIIKVTDHKAAGLTPFEKVKGDIVENLQQGRKNEAFKGYVEKLRAEANVVYPPGKEPAVTPGMPGAPMAR